MSVPDDVTTLFLRGVPRHLVREAKAAAARDGVTLAHWVSERLAQATGSNAPRAAGAAGADSLRFEMEWFEANQSRLESKHAGQYVAIIDQRVVDHDAAFDALARRVFARFGTRSICMPKVGRTVVRVRSPRRARP